MQLDDYILLEEIGRGGSSVVFKGFKTGFPDQLVAIKVAKPQTDKHQLAFKRFEVIREAEILSHLNHPHIVTVFGCSISGILRQDKKILLTNLVYNVIQLGEQGRVLDYLREGGPFSEPLCKFYFKQLVDGLFYIHSKGIVHRDLKPDNLLLGPNYELLIADFGHSALVIGPKEDGWLLRDSAGTECYNPPETRLEKFRGQPADVFMLGVILFILITGRKPFEYSSNFDIFYRFIAESNAEGFWEKHRSTNNIQVSKEIRYLVSKMLHVDPSSRPSLLEICKDPWLHKSPIANFAKARREINRRKALYYSSNNFVVAR